MRLKRKPSKPERKEIQVFLSDMVLDSVADAMELKYQFHKEFKDGSKGHKDFYWHDFSIITDNDVFLSIDEYCESCYVLIPESPDKWEKRLNKYNERLEAYNEWAVDKVDEIAAEEKRREKLATKKKRDKLMAINERIAELSAQAKELEDEAS